MSLHAATTPKASQLAKDLADYFNERWGGPHFTYEAHGESVTEWGPRNSRVIPSEDLDSYIAMDDFRAYVRRRRRAENT